ncbi:MAG: CueP family metal-binding protein [Mobilicoccus sp.]|nr:CueP family metal-binding protein [Mobilicoccus sp.]
MTKRALSLALAVTLFAAGCGTAQEAPEETAAPATATQAEETPPADEQTAPAGQGVIDTVPDKTGNAPAVAEPLLEDPVLSEFGLNGKSVVEIVDFMDETNAHRDSGLNGSIRYDHLKLTNENTGDETEVPVPDDLFYMSVAPYVTQTHECFNHSLTGCVGENAETEMDVTVTDSEGTVLFDGPATTFENGFIGFWLPRDITGTMEVTYDGKSGSMEFGTGEDSPTCITTLQLS